MKNILLALVCAWCPILLMNAQEIIKPETEGKTAFAIVVDSETYNAAKEEILAYQKSVESDGLPTYIIYKNWSNPEELKELLYRLYQDKKQPLEGAVFIGDIPVPMIRQAQPLTSAFKMTETLRWDRSSVPSDRFYDDFDLKFDFLKQDSTHSNYYYYNLSAESPHFIEMDIYSGRIKPPVAENSEPAIHQIKAYLRKLVEVRAEDNPLNHMIVSKGHGYNSNSVISTGHEMMAIRSTFPKLFTPGHSVQFLNYQNAEFLKNPLLTKLRDEGADFAYMTGHGTTDLQLLNGYPAVSNPQPSMENVARHVRSKMNSAKEREGDIEEVKTRLQTNLGLNDKWFEDAFDKDRAIEDSIYNQQMDIHSVDLDNINVRVAYLNSCFTGAFHLKDYLAGHYPFSNGKNVVAIANSIGVLQDLWGSELLGILQYGVRVGHLLKKTAYLETHILGDPTFHFTSEEHYNSLFAAKETSQKDWNTLLESGDADLQAYALTELAKREKEVVFSKQLVEIFKTSPRESVRTQAYYLLRAYNNESFRQILPLALNDNYEYIKRKAVYDINDIGEDSYIDALVDLYVNDQEMERIQYKINWAFQFFDYDQVIARLNSKLKGNLAIPNAEELLKRAVTRVEREKSSNAALIKTLQDPDISDKELNGQIRSLRLYRRHSAVPYVLDIIQDTNHSEEIRTTALEALSWFGMSYQKEKILQTCDSLHTDASEAVRRQALKTKQVLQDAPNRPF